MIRYFVLLYSVSSVLCVCPNGYEALGNGDCYKTVTTPSVQRDGESFCEQEGGNLIQPQNAFVDAKIRTEANNVNMNLWLGITCLENTTTSCTYSNGDSVISTAYTNFYPDHPDPKVGNCVFLSISGSQNGKWVSGNCHEQKLGFGCLLSAESLLPNYVPKCGSSYQEFDEYCYKKTHPAMAKKGELICELECGHITSIHSQQENNFIRSFSLSTGESRVFIGLERTNNRDYQWFDGSISPLQDYSNFGRNDSNQGDCVAMSLIDNEGTEGGWINTRCADSLPSLCKRPRTRPCVSFTHPFIAPTCPYTFNLTGNGTIYSPGFPSSYPNGLECEYDIRAPPGFVVFLVLNSVLYDDYYYNFPDSASNISLFEGISESVPFLPRLYHGNNVNTFYASTTSSMKVKFSSGSSYQYRWSANYTSVDIRPSGCNRGVLETPGRLTSPNYSHDPWTGNNVFYPSCYNCTYQLKAPTGKRITINFDEFWTRDQGDLVFVFDGPDSKSSLLLQVWGGFGRSQPHNVTSSSNQMFVKFTTNDDGSTYGFSATFTAV